MSDELVAAAIGAMGAVGTALGVIGKSVFDRLRSRDQLQADVQGRLIQQLLERNGKLEAKVEEMQLRLEECQEHHRECTVRTERVQVLLEAALERIERLEGVNA